MKKHCSLVATLLLLVGCNSQLTDQNASPQQNPRHSVQVNSQQYIEQTAEQLYLRGSFNLWGYHKQYKLLQVDSRTFAASAELTQGQRYEFMFSAKDASKPNSNCGYKNQAVIVANRKFVASCNNIVQENFIFTPKKSGVYEFFLELASINRPIVYIKKVY